MTCATSEDTQISLAIRPVFAVRSMGKLGPKASSCGQRMLIRVLAVRTDHVIGFVMFWLINSYAIHWKETYDVVKHKILK